MKKQRRYLAMFLLSVVSIAIPSTAEAGPLLDWLFQKNRSQGLANTAFNPASQYATNPSIANQYRANPYSAARPIGGGTAGRAPCGSCLTNLFRGNRNGQTNAYRPNSNAYAAGGQSNVYGNTAGYAPQAQGGCSSGWCQQTVVRWIPQTAYRTAYQPVPVTTYKTSTTINPANGLPRTCTRPCTSYSMQARRVPYTSYRPVYTTVPVADTFGKQQPPATAGNNYGNPAAGYPAAPPISNYALQPPSTAPVAPGGCSNCQNRNSGYTATPGFNNWQNIPGYTPGNATNFPPPSAGTPWSNSPLAGPSANAPGATPWQPTNPGSNFGYQSDPQSAPPRSQSQAPGLGATEWAPLDRRGSTQPPRGGTPADRQPRLDPADYPDAYGSSSLRPLEPPPMPDRIRRRINSQTESRFVPRETAKPESSYWEDKRRQEEAYAYQRRAAERAERERSNLERDRLFRTPQDNDYAAPQEFPITPPTNNRGIGDTGTRDVFRGGGIRAQEPTRNWTNLDDKTAERNRPSGDMPVIEETTRTRYAATPIQWTAPKQLPRRESANDWRNDANRWRNETRRQSDWTPRR